MEATVRDLSPSERLLQSILTGSMSDDDTGISDAVVEWTDNEGRRWRRSVRDDFPKQIL